MMKTKNLKMQILYSLTQTMMWAEYCAGISFATVYMQYKGLSNTMLGTVSALGMVLGFFVSSYLASVVDRRGKFTLLHAIWLFLGVQGLLSGCFAVLDITGPLFCVMYCLLICSVTGIISMITQLCFELEMRGNGTDFGSARAIGSMGYAIVSAIMGVTVRKLGAGIVPAAGLVFILLEGVTVLGISRDMLRNPVLSGNTHVGKARSTAEFLRANPRFGMLLLAIILIFFSHNVSSLFLINVVTNVGGDVSTMGGMNSFTGFIEIPAIMFYGIISRRIKCRNILRFAVIMFVVKGLGIALASSVGWLYAAESMQALSFAVYCPAIVHYTILSVSPEDSTKGQALAQGMTTVGACLASSLGGVMFDAVSVRAALLSGAAVCAAGSAIAVAVTGKKQ